MHSDIAAITSSYQNKVQRPASIILKCMTAGVFNRFQLLQMLEGMTEEEFSSFCSEIIVLQHFTDQHKHKIEEYSPEPIEESGSRNFRNSIPR
jgi:hypothetical protein